MKVVPDIDKNDPDILEFLRANSDEKLATLYIMLRDWQTHVLQNQKDITTLKKIIYFIVLPALGIASSAAGFGVM